MKHLLHGILVLSLLLWSPCWAPAGSISSTTYSDGNGNAPPISGPQTAGNGVPKLGKIIHGPVSQVGALPNIVQINPSITATGNCECLDCLANEVFSQDAVYPNHPPCEECPGSAVSRTFSHAKMEAIGGQFVFYDSLVYTNGNQISPHTFYESDTESVQPAHPWTGDSSIYNTALDMSFNFFLSDSNDLGENFGTAPFDQKDGIMMAKHDYGLHTYTEPAFVVRACSPVENHKYYSWAWGTSGGSQYLIGIGGTHDAAANFVIADTANSADPDDLWVANAYVDYDNGGQTLGAGDEPTAGDVLVDAGGTGTGYVMEVTTDGGTSWANGDASGRIYLLCSSDDWTEDNKINNSTTSENSIADIAALEWVPVVGDYMTYGVVGGLSDGTVYVSSRMDANRYRKIRFSTMTRLMADPTDWGATITLFNNSDVDKMYVTAPLFDSNGEIDMAATFASTNDNGDLSHNTVTNLHLARSTGDTWTQIGATDEYSLAVGHDVSDIFWGGTELTEEVGGCAGAGADLDDNEWCNNGGTIIIQGAVGNYNPNDGDEVEVLTGYYQDGTIYASLPVTHKSGDEDVAVDCEYCMVSDSTYDESGEFWIHYAQQALFTHSSLAQIGATNEYSESYDESEFDPHRVFWDTTELTEVTGTDCADGDDLSDEEFCYNSGTDTLVVEGPAADKDPSGNTITSRTYFHDNYHEIAHYDTGTSQWDTFTVGTNYHWNTQGQVGVDGYNNFYIYGVRSDGKLYQNTDHIDSGNVGDGSGWTETVLRTPPATYTDNTIGMSVSASKNYKKGNNIELIVGENGGNVLHYILPDGIETGTSDPWVCIGCNQVAESSFQAGAGYIYGTPLEDTLEQCLVKEFGETISTGPFIWAFNFEVQEYEDSTQAVLAMCSDPTGAATYDCFYDHTQDATSDCVYARIYAETVAPAGAWTGIRMAVGEVDGTSVNESAGVQLMRFEPDTIYYCEMIVWADETMNVMCWDNQAKLPDESCWISPTVDTTDAMATGLTHAIVSNWNEPATGSANILELRLVGPTYAVKP